MMQLPAMPPVEGFGPAELETLTREHPELRMIDVRTPAEFASGHISGSYNVPLPDLAEHRSELTATGAGPVVLICRSGRRADTASDQLRAAGLDDVHVLVGGVQAWETSGRPLLRFEDSRGWTIERQVRFTAGAVVAAATVASIWWAPARFLAGALGLGLVVAAVTDTCAMGNLLARLPFNRRRGEPCDLPSLVATITANDSSAHAAVSREVTAG
jgi:rhodanese-related sulfurtransferase